MTQRDPGTSDLGPAEDTELEDEEPVEDEDAESEEPADEDEEAEEPAVGPVTGRGRRGSAPRRLLGRRAAEADATRPAASVRTHERVRIDDRASAVFAIVAAASLIGVLLFSLTFAPGGFFNARKTPAPLPSVSTAPAIVTPAAGLITPTPAASGSTSAAPSASSSTAPSASPSPTASGS